MIMESAHVVHGSGVELIGGDKRFGDAIVLNGLDEDRASAVI
jgi:hypothetical protein